MTLATVAWGIVWAALWASKLGWFDAPERWVYTVAAMPAVLGTAYALATVRVRPAWVFMAIIPLFANGSLLALPFVFGPEFKAAFAG